MKLMKLMKDLLALHACPINKQNKVCLYFHEQISNDG